ncbi:hypothetical protein [Methanosphaera sp.]
MKIVELPVGSENKSYYKYINMDLTPIEKEEKILTSLEQDKTKALEFKNRSNLTKDDFIPEEEWYYILDDGTIVISTAVELENMTGEMLDFLWYGILLIL